MPTYNPILGRYIYPTENASAEKVFPYADPLTMFPTLIKHYDIDISTEANYNDTTKEFKITSVDWVNKIITTDKKVILPNIQNEVNAQYWQMYVLANMGTAGCDTLLQLTSQIDATTFSFEIAPSQQTGTVGCLLNAEIVNQGIGYSDQDALYVINPINVNENYTQISINVAHPYNVTIGEIVASEVGYIVGNIYATNYSGSIPPNPLEKGTGDNNLTIRCTSITDSTSPTLKTNFAQGVTIGFRNPQQTWIPLSLTQITEHPQVYYNHYCRYISRYNNKFIALILYYAGGASYGGFGITQSNDFITWDAVTNIAPISIGSLPSWMDDHSIIIPCISSNNVNNNIHTLLFEQIGKGFGIMTTSDFLHYTYSANKFTYTGTINGGNVVFLGEGSYIYYKGIHYIGLTVQLDNDVREFPYLACLFTWGGNLNDMSLTFVQALGLGRPQHSWNCGYTELPSMYEVNNKLYCMCVGDDNGYVGEIGNQGKTNGLYIFNDSTGLFEEYMSNPVIMNVELNEDYAGYRDHQDAIMVFPYNSKLYGMIGFNETTDSYKVIPAQICMKNKTMVDDWKTQTINLNV